MNAIPAPLQLAKFPEVNATYAEDQPEYMPLPCHKHYDNFGKITCLWKLTWGAKTTSVIHWGNMASSIDIWASTTTAVATCS